jgi:hypothetical protein
MQKFSFTVDIVTDSPAGVDVDGVRGSLLAAIDGIGTLAAVHGVKTETMKEQGYNVWAKRVAGVSLATPKVKAPKAPKAPKAEVAETVEA